MTQEMVLSLAGVVTAVGGAWLTVRKIARDAKREKKEYTAEILQQAKEEIREAKTDIINQRNLIQKEFEARLGTLEQELSTHKESVEKDFAHVRETYNSEIRNLGQKIEDLRSELRGQHTQMVALLTKMIGPKD